jgi:hypothetical protein
MKSKGAGNKIAAPTSPEIWVRNGSSLKQRDFTAYLIEENNYFQLLEIAKLLNIRATWDSSKNAVVISTDKTYLEPGVTAAFSINGISEGMSVADAEKVLGTPYRTLTAPAWASFPDRELKFYGENTHFTALVIADNEVIGLAMNYGIPTAPGDGYTRAIDRDDNYYLVEAGASLDNTNGDDLSEQVLFEAVNAYRGFYGVAALPWDAELSASARSHSEYQREIGEVTHSTGPNEIFYTKAQFGENCTNSGGALRNLSGWALSTAGHQPIMLSTSRAAMGVGKAGPYATLRLSHEL